MVSFTGSEAVGIAIMQQAAATLKRVHLELGGKSALIVRADADVQQAALGAVAGLTVNCGQGCALLTRFLVHNSIRAQFVEIAKAVAEQWKIGDPRRSDRAHGTADPRVTARQSRAARFARAATKAHAWCCGGGRPAHLSKGFFTDITSVR